LAVSGIVVVVVVVAGCGFGGAEAEERERRKIKKTVTTYRVIYEYSISKRPQIPPPWSDKNV
jgi:hypothetical protein